ncbi:MAG: IPT/TIG domain-containing protein [Dehalococcoidia bacterium]|nr:IPT/TIG domain-containing protein [Dehalococcoidia bacterium]
MKTKIFASVWCMIFLLTICFVSPVRAVAGMAPTEGVVGTTVTISGLVSGTYSIRWDAVGVKQGTLSAAGSVSFNVPDTAGGAHTVTVIDNSGSQVFTFSVLPSISISADSGVEGDEITVDGNGFAVSESNIVVTYDGTNTKTGITAGSTGSWETTFALPTSAKGSHSVGASGQTTNASNVPSVTVTINPRISMSPASGNVGNSVTVSGTGFGKSEGSIVVAYDGTNIKTGLSADSKGSWDVAFIIPNSTKGGHTIDASGSSTEADDVPDLTFIVSSAVTVKPGSGYVGDTITIAGCGFGGNESGITITLDDNIIKSDVVANSEGCWNSSMTVPAAIAGNHVIDAYGASTMASEVAGTKLVILSKLTLEPVEGHVGSNIAMNGTGFGAGKAVTLKYDSIALATEYTSDDKGNFQASLVAPKSPGGKHNVIATDADGASATAVFSMESTPPPVPQIVSPKKGSRTGLFDHITPTFEWAAVSDPSGISYTLEISTQSDFATTLISKENLAEPKYTLTDQEALSRGQYYWRVKAIDGASNDSGWTQSIAFKAGLMPLWAFILVVIVGIAFLTRLYFFTRKMGKGH